MRRTDREITDIEEIESIIAAAQVCRLAMVDRNEPYVVPMNFGYRDHTLFFHSALKGRKLDLIRANNHVCFEVDIVDGLKTADAACDWGIRYRSVIGVGRASIVDDPDKKRQALDAIMAHYSDKSYTYGDEQIRSVAVIRVDIEQMTGKRA